MRRKQILAATRDTAPTPPTRATANERSSAQGYVLPATLARGPAEGSHQGKKPCFRVSAAACAVAIGNFGLH